MPETNNAGRGFVRQDGRIQVMRGGSMVLLPQGYQFASMTLEQLEEVDASCLTTMEVEAYVARVEHLMELSEIKRQRMEVTRQRQLSYVRSYGKKG